VCQLSLRAGARAAPRRQVHIGGRTTVKPVRRVVTPSKTAIPDSDGRAGEVRGFTSPAAKALWRSPAGRMGECASRARDWRFVELGARGRGCATRRRTGSSAARATSRCAHGRRLGGEGQALLTSARVVSTRRGTESRIDDTHQRGQVAADLDSPMWPPQRRRFGRSAMVIPARVAMACR